MKPVSLFAAVLFLSIQHLSAQQGKKDPSKYLGEEQPGLMPKLFAPGVVSVKDQFEYGSAFSADGKNSSMP